MGQNNNSESADAAWLTKPEALAALNKSERSLDRMVSAGKVERRTRPQGQGKPPQAIFSRADIERASAVEAFPMPENGNQMATVHTNGARNDLAIGQLLAAVVTQMQTQFAPTPRQPAGRPLWLTLKDAAAYSGLSAKLLRELIASDRLPAVRDSRQWKIRREDLEGLRAPGVTRANGNGVARSSAAQNGAHG
jgi:excisionase family DNA binding protein